MPNLDLRAFEDTIVLHFGVEGGRINAYTLASTLINLADAAKAANAELNPGYEIEIVVEALGRGSFKATIRAIYRGAGNIFSKENLKALVIAVIAAYIYQHTLAPDTEIEVNVISDEVVIEQGDTRVVVPREVHDATRELTDNQRFIDSVGRAMQCVAEDEKVTSIGFSPHVDSTEPVEPIPKERLMPLFTDTLDEPPDVREFVETAELQIVRAILERSRRRWEFVWNGIRISAPVTDGDFYTQFFEHRIMIAPGDSLKVRLKIRQRRNRDLKIYVNESYEVIQVIEHIPRGASGVQMEGFE